ncbi:hypothetical protein Pyn_13111 [Prunus yedoensis var. nudiflora]|uniref:Uncharacterized protein n=1 Tax=Prunus yedoensis var. nudiflora TaxID=2094558 RepID=A0A314XKS1_PRUYE|nr:hypothetical protein Pyn_13111 [Prunus yedoensis var. nudiflora]
MAYPCPSQSQGFWKCCLNKGLPLLAVFPPKEMTDSFILSSARFRVNDLEGIDLSGLEQKLAELVSPYSSRCISE